MSQAAAESGLASPWAFHAHPDVWLLIVTLVAGYVLALKVLAPGHSPPGQPAVTRREMTLYGAGVALLWLGADWPIHDLSEGYLFSVHMVQHMIFSLMAPPLLLMGTPRWLLRALLSPPGVLRVVRVLTKPVVALVIFNAYVAISHWPDLVNLALRVEAVHLLMHTVLVATSFMMWWPVVGRLPELPQLSPPAKMLYLFLQSVLPTVPASFLTFAERPIYRFYESVPHPWVDALTDSRISGLIMKLGGGALLWGIIAVLFFQWNAREEQQHQQDEIAWDDFERELQVWDLRK
jgi:putative membrane protein